MSEILVDHTIGDTAKPYHRLRWIWQYRYFLWMFIYRRIRTQYAGSVLGIIWSLLNPLMMTVVFSVMRVFILTGGPIEAYPVFLLAGLLPWNFFTAGLSAAVTSIISERDLVLKVHLPTELLTAGAVLTMLSNFLGGLLVFFPLALILGRRFTWWLLLLPLIMLLEILFVLGLGFFLAAANVLYRDVQAILRVILQAWFFLTPIWYSMDSLPRQFTVAGFQIDVWRWVRILNPMASLIAAYRDVMYYGRSVDPAFLLRTSLTVLFFFGLGYSFFLKVHTRFPEEL